MCKFCEINAMVETCLPKDNPHAELDSNMVMMFGDTGWVRVAGLEGRSWNKNHPLPIFDFEVLFCPYCGRKVKDKLELSKFV